MCTDTIGLVAIMDVKYWMIDYVVICLRLSGKGHKVTVMN